MSKASSPGFISLEKAIEMTTRYRENKDLVINPSYVGKEILAICDKFSRNVFDILLAKPGCTAIRLYYGMDAELKIHPIIVGVNEKDQDMLTVTSNLDGDGDEDEIADDTLRCPPLCPPPSPLNG